MISQPDASWSYCRAALRPAYCCPVCCGMAYTTGKFGQLLWKDVSQISHHKEQHCRRCHGTSLLSQAAVCVSAWWEQYAIFSFLWDRCRCGSSTDPFPTTGMEMVGNCIGSPCEVSKLSYSLHATKNSSWHLCQESWSRQSWLLS